MCVGESANMEEVDGYGKGYPGLTGRAYRVVDGELKWGWIGKQKFPFVKGNKYQVRHASRDKALHKDAVGVLAGVRYRQNDKDDIVRVVLECCGTPFHIDPIALVPYDGEITEEHVKLITPLRRKVHLAENGKCVCKCDLSPGTNPTGLVQDDFVAVPENKRCTNCNRILRGRERQRST